MSTHLFFIALSIINVCLFVHLYCSYLGQQQETAASDLLLPPPTSSILQDIDNLTSPQKGTPKKYLTPRNGNNRSTGIFIYNAKIKEPEKN